MLAHPSFVRFCVAEKYFIRCNSGRGAISELYFEITKNRFLLDCDKQFMETVGKLNIKCQHEKFPKEINATGTTPTNRIELSIRFVFEKLHALR